MNLKLEAARLKLGLSKTELAKKAEISPMSYWRYEKEQRNPRVDIARAIAKVLNSTVEELFDPPSAPTEGGETKRA
jgi:DNA-binding XRE family transcriptional regulator